MRALLGVHVRAEVHELAELADRDVARAVGVERDPHRLEPRLAQRALAHAQLAAHHRAQLVERDRAAAVDVDVAEEAEPRAHL